MVQQVDQRIQKGAHDTVKRQSAYQGHHLKKHKFDCYSKII